MIKILLRCLGGSFHIELHRTPYMSARAMMMQRQTLIRGASFAWITALQVFLHLIFIVVITVLVAALWIFSTPHQFIVDSVISRNDVLGFVWVMWFIMSEVLAHVFGRFYVHPLIKAWMDSSRGKISEKLSR